MALAGAVKRAVLPKYKSSGLAGGMTVYESASRGTGRRSISRRSRVQLRRVTRQRATRWGAFLVASGAYASDR